MKSRSGWLGLAHRVALLSLVTFLLGGHCGMEERGTDPEIADIPDPTSAATPNRFHQCAEFTETRRPFFGELHVHTTNSLDANLEGTRLTPRDAYRFAKGHAVELPKTTKTVKIARPLDFAAVTDHAEFLGFIGLCSDPKSGRYHKRGCEIYRKRPNWGVMIIDAHLSDEDNFHNPPRACGDAGDYCYPYREQKWLEIQQEAEAQNDQSDKCRFSTFVAYEWSASPGDGVVKVGKVHNMHRNVIFRNATVPHVPVDFFDAAHVQNLWAGLRKHCLDANNGCDVLAIPHNANLSAGRMFDERMFERHKKDTPPMTAEYAKEQNAMEPLMEIYQHKGSSECLPGQTSGDELCGFEVVPYDNLRAAKMDKHGEINVVDTMRYGLGEGLRLGEKLGTNPFQFGIISSSDNHLGLPGNSNESKFVGGGGASDVHLGSDVVEFPDRIFFGGGGLAGLWAEENSREALFRALRRKETFGTSGTRLSARMFGGWDFPKQWCEMRDRAKVGYERGVPMGSEMTGAPGPKARPVFAIEAIADAGTTKLPGAKLQRIQVVKGYLDDDGKPQTRIFDVAGDAKRGQDINLDTCEPSEDGFNTLCATWRDETFRPDQRAYYYVRVTEVPTCRWSTRMCVAAKYDCDNQTRTIDKQCCGSRAGLHPRNCGEVVCDEAHADDSCCQPNVVSPVIHERAWTSPIWYTPATRQ
jgi:hypothetical protein